MTTIAGKTILITGASRGIGAVIAGELAQQQATIVGVARSQTELERVCADIRATGGKASAIAGDISQVEQLATLVAEIEARVGSIDILVNNAGIEIYQAFPDCSLTQIQSVLSVNLLAAMELTRLLLPSMLQQCSGHIINIASLASKKGHPYDSIYSASKAGLLMWGNALRQELADTGVEISAICPGYVANCGLLADTGVPAPSLAGVSKSQDVAQAVVKAIAKNRAEVIVNGNLITENLTRLLLASEQFFPRLGDSVNRWLGVTKLNQRRIGSMDSRVKSNKQSSLIR
ncbi:MAG: SDR family NAD(P)-dependent oxidoreductase [Cyanobacteria bacterium J06631_2]